ncbi:hypothetical protein G5I_14454 [Acromyrmex echinatior]|uniref:Uncharacterized protein n=1 Tax=Acromyrmex echinatior TaxID=103372 RepID=F4X7S0_ACREC|nr:hypothetical protein G5I_14454 [Acromyrmex echinatior]
MEFILRQKCVFDVKLIPTKALPVIGKTHSQHNDRSCSHKELLTLHGKFGTIKNQIVDSDASRAEKGRRGGPDREECHRLNIDQRADTI